jgi:hypothetical protein
MSSGVPGVRDVVYWLAAVPSELPLVDQPPLQRHKLELRSEGFMIAKTFI